MKIQWQEEAIEIDDNTPRITLEGERIAFNLNKIQCNLSHDDEYYKLDIVNIKLGMQLISPLIGSQI